MSLKSGKEPGNLPLNGPHFLVFQEAVSGGVCDEEDADAAGGGGDTDRGQEAGGGRGGGGGHLHEVRHEVDMLYFGPAIKNYTKIY